MKKIMQRTKQILDIVLSAGVARVPEKFRERVRTVNLTTIIAILLSIANQFLFFQFFPDKIGLINFYPVFVQIIFIAIYSSCFWFNHKGQFITAAVILTFNAIAQLSLLPVLFLGKQTGVQIYLITITPLGLLYLNRARELIIIGIATVVSLALFIWIEFYGQDPLFHSLEYTPLIQQIYQVNFIFAILMISVITVIFARDLNQAKDQTNDLLLNILPYPIASRLKQKTDQIADRHQDASILFADIVNFTRISEELTAFELVSFLNKIFTKFDQLVEDLELEKIKTIGDSYMVAGGIPLADPANLQKICRLAIRMRDAVKDDFSKTYPGLDIRIGIHTGEVVAGVIGRSKFCYDLWGDNVNIASRLESSGFPGKIHISREVREKLGNNFSFSSVGEIHIKGKGMMETFILEAELVSVKLLTKS